MDSVTGNCIDIHSGARTSVVVDIGQSQADGPINPGMGIGNVAGKAELESARKIKFEGKTFAHNATEHQSDSPRIYKENIDATIPFCSSKGTAQQKHITTENCAGEVAETIVKEFEIIQPKNASDTGNSHINIPIEERSILRNRNVNVGDKNPLRETRADENIIKKHMRDDKITSLLFETKEIIKRSNGFTHTESIYNEAMGGSQENIIRGKPKYPSGAPSYSATKMKGHSLADVTVQDSVNSNLTSLAKGQLIRHATSPLQSKGGGTATDIDLDHIALIKDIQEKTVYPLPQDNRSIQGKLRYTSEIQRTKSVSYDEFEPSVDDDLENEIKYPRTGSRRIMTPQSIRRRVKIYEYRKKQKPIPEISSFRNSARNMMQIQQGLGVEWGSTLLPTPLDYSKRMNPPHAQSVDRPGFRLRVKTVDRIVVLRWTLLIGLFILAVLSPSITRSSKRSINTNNIILNHTAELNLEKYNFVESLNKFHKGFDETRNGFVGAPVDLSSSLEVKLPDNSNDIMTPMIRIIEPSEDGTELPQGNVVIRAMIENVYPEVYAIHSDPKICLSLTSETSGANINVGCIECQVGLVCEIVLRNIKPDRLNLHTTLLSRVKKLARADRKFIIGEHFLGHDHEIVASGMSLNSVSTPGDHKNIGNLEEVCETTCSRTCKSRTTVN